MSHDDASAGASRASDADLREASDASCAARPDVERLRRWVGREYWPSPDDLAPEPVRAVDLARYASAIGDMRGGRAVDPGSPAPPGFMEVASPNYLLYYRMSGEEFLRHLLPFESPWGADWAPMMLVRSERWEIERPVVVGDVLRGRSTITDITWQDARGERPEMLGVEFTKVYRDAADRRVGTVVWDMVFVERALVDRRSDAAAARARPDDVVRRHGATPRADDPVGRYTRQFDMEALVRWSAAIWDLGLPHVDGDYARRVYGLPGAVAHGPFINASLARLTTDWMDAGDRVVAHRGRFRRPVVAGDRLTFAGVVADVAPADCGRIAVVKAVAVNQYDEIVAESETRCALSGG